LLCIEGKKASIVQKRGFEVRAARLLIGLLLAWGSLTWGSAAAMAEQWPEFRGPTGQGLSSALHWRERLGGSFSASPVHAEGQIYLSSEQGMCTVISASREYRQLGSNDLGEPILASCALADGAMFIRTESSLYRIE
jgi:hypothetical protein